MMSSMNVSPLLAHQQAFDGDPFFRVRVSLASEISAGSGYLHRNIVDLLVNFVVTHVEDFGTVALDCLKMAIITVAMGFVALLVYQKITGKENNAPTSDTNVLPSLFPRGAEPGTELATRIKQVEALIEGQLEKIGTEGVDRNEIMEELEKLRDLKKDLQQALQR